MELVGYGFILLGASYLLGLIAAPLLDKWWTASRDISTDTHNIAHVKQIEQTRKQLEEKRRVAGKSRDMRIDELLAANKTDEAKLLLEEKLRNAHEQGNETLVQLYKKYLAEMEDSRPPAEK